MNNVAKGAALMAGVTYEIKLNNGFTNYWPMKLEPKHYKTTWILLDQLHNSEELAFADKIMKEMVWKQKA
jgi:metal-dependent amidase/aminoacylase/carboxypeptidase family protein